MPEKPCAELVPLTFGDLIRAVEIDDTLEPNKRDNIVSSLRSFLHYVDAEPSLRAEFETVRAKQGQYTPAKGRAGRRRWQNILSHVRFTLKHYGPEVSARAPQKLSREWTALLGQLIDLDLRAGLSRFIHWCNQNGVVPNDINDDTLNAFRTHLKSGTTVKSPNAITRRAAMCWNRAANGQPAWPDSLLTIPDFRRRVSLPLKEFPYSFRRDLEKYIATVDGSDVFSEDASDRALRPATVDSHRSDVLRAASMLVRSGYPIDDVRSLSTLVEPENFRSFLRAYRDHLGNMTAGLHHVSATLLRIARHYVRVPDEQLSQLRSLHARIGPRKLGMTEKNLEAIRPFLDEKNQAIFLNFGSLMMKQARKLKSNKHRMALCVQTALMHEIMLVAPMRFSNLSELNINEHIRYAQSGKSGKVHIVVPGSQVKNRQPLIFELAQEALRVLRSYLRDYRSILVSNSLDNGFLFPGRESGHKAKNAMRTQLSGALKRYAGIHLTPHNYRHLAAFFYLQSHPGDYETVRRILGHKSIRTTIAYYVSFERYSASERYNKAILERRTFTSGRAA